MIWLEIYSQKMLYNCHTELTWTQKLASFTNIEATKNNLHANTVCDTQKKLAVVKNNLYRAVSVD